MIEGLKPYPEYKPAGLPWLDAVPKHWDLAPNRALMRDRRDRVGEEAPDYTLLSLTLRGVIARDMENPKGKFPAQFNTYKIVRPNDFVFCLFDIDETPRGVGLSGQRGMITGAYDVFSPTPRINPRFLYHYYLFVDEGKLMKPFYTGLRKTIQRGTFASLKAPLPPPDEQLAIVRFLDHANRKIDGFIRAKRKLIALLNEQKQAIIHRAVTRGLNPNAKLKPSGIPWLGEIPEHWEVLRARFVFRAVTRRDVRATDPKLSVTQRRGLVPTDGMEENSTQARDYDRFQVCHEQDLVLNKYKAHLGIFCCAFQRGLITPNYTVFRPIRKLNTRFFDILFHTATYRNEFSMIVYGVTEGMSPLYTQDFYRVPVLFPPPDEQNAILAELEQRTKTQNTAIARTEREIALMQEYRTRLTADIVTGKLDVREGAAKLPKIETDEVTKGTSDDLEDNEEEMPD